MKQTILHAIFATMYKLIQQIVPLRVVALQQSELLE